MILWLLPALAALVLLGSYLCYYLTFRVPKHPPAPKEEYPLPRGRIYEAHRDVMVGWMKQTRAMAFEPVQITAFDGLTLRGKYYEQTPGAPIELMVHGYRGTAERDLCGGVQRAFAMGHNALLIDQRCSGGSGGTTITFGIREHRDCRDWIDFLNRRFGPQTPIALTGISMGASTVLLAAGAPLPENVKLVLADCGYTSARAIICHVIRQLHLPPRLLYPLVRLGARIYGGFDPDSCSPLEAVQQTTVPTIFIHGTADRFVPCRMSQENYEACAAPKTLLQVDGAGHGLSYLTDGPGYMRALAAFANAHGFPTRTP